MSKESITIKELKEKFPIDLKVYEFRKFARYMLVVKPSRLVGSSSISPEMALEIMKWFAKSGISAFIVQADLDDVKIYEMKADK